MTDLERRGRLASAIDKDPVTGNLRAVVSALLEEGETATVLLEDLAALRRLYPDDTADRVMDVMDMLSGWCGPNARLPADPS